jgi:putative cell wall-binding protein
MASRGNNHIRRGRRTAAGAAVTALTTALGLAVGSAAPAQAAGGWNPQDWGMPYLPTASVDGEITVTQVAGDGKSVMRSFRRDGTAVAGRESLTGKEHVWSPGGDVISTQGLGSAWRLLGTGDAVTNRFTYSPAQWSPMGDSTVESLPLSGKPVSTAKWTGNYYRSDVLLQTGSDPGAAAVTPDGYGVVVTIPSPAVPGKSDLGLSAKGSDEFPAFPRIANKTLQTPLSAPTPLGYGALDARLPSVAADGTLAFVGTGDKGPALFVDEGQGPVAVAALGGACAGQRPSFAPSAKAVAYLASNADCTSTSLHVLTAVDGSFVGGSDTLVTASPAGTTFVTPSWRAETPAAQSLRLGGKDRVATGVAVSKEGWPDGSSGAVLASSMSFPDALVGTPLAGDAGFPLLVNGPTALDSRVLTELKRLMPNPEDRYVYVIGGPGVLSSGVEKSLRNNGFGVARLYGADRFATSVAVAKEMDAAWAGTGAVRRSVFLADGMSFPDALTAGPAATVFSAPVLLTNGRTSTTAVKSYIGGRSAITDVYGIGGNGAAAARAYKKKVVEVYGADRYATGASVARQFFAQAYTAGFASGVSFPDALTGGALQANMWEPLLLVRPDFVPASTRDQAVDYRASTDTVVVYGGTGAVSDGVKKQLVDSAGRQTALWGWTTPLEPNPDMPQTLGGRSAQHQTGQVRDFRSANASAVESPAGAGAAGGHARYVPGR